MYACNKELDQSNNLSEINTTDKLEKVNIHIDSISIEVDSILSFYTVFNFLPHNKDIVFLGYDHTRHSINTINISTKKVLKVSKLSKEGPQGVGEINGIYCQSLDSIFVFSSNGLSLYLLNRDGLIIHKWPMNEKDSRNEKFYIFNQFTLIKPDGFYFDNTTKDVYIRNYYYEKSISKESKEYFANAKLLGKFNIIQNTPSLLNIEYSNVLKTNYVGYLHDPYITFINKHGVLEKIVYNFPATSEIFSYDNLSKRVTQYNAKSRPVELHIDFLNWKDSNKPEKLLSSLNTDVIYGKVIHINDQNKDMFFQFCMDKPKNSAAKTSTPSVRKVFLNIYDSNFNRIYTTEMPYKMAHFFNSFYYEGKIFVPILKSENELTFTTIKIKFNNEYFIGQ
ncbi:hypothetical protein GCM10027190_14300 [Spirosoma areae]